jgi:hypothetical protein
MHSKISGCPKQIVVDVFLNVDGELTVDVVRNLHDEDSIHFDQTSLEALTAEFIRDSTDPETGRIENKHADPCYLLLESFKRSTRMLEDAVFDVSEADNQVHEGMQ